MSGRRRTPNDTARDVEEGGDGIACERLEAAWTGVAGVGQSTADEGLDAEPIDSASYCVVQYKTVI